jgi:hypothetical protein
MPDSWSMFIANAMAAATNPLVTVALVGVPVEGLSRLNHRGSRPSRAMAIRTRGCIAEGRAIALPVTFERFQTVEVVCEGQNYMRRMCTQAGLVLKKAGAGHHHQDMWLHIKRRLSTSKRVDWETKLGKNAISHWLCQVCWQS